MKYKQLSNEVWLREQIKEKPLRQIADEVGCSYSGVLYASRRFNIEIPRRFTHRFSPTKSENIKKALREKYPDGMFGDKAPNWKGGRQKHGEYVVLYSRDHPRAHKSNRVFEHIVVAEKTLGRYIGRDEIVHHINGKKDDNRPENLEVYKRTEHYHHHMTSGKSLQKLHKHIEYLQNLLTENNIEY